MDLNITRHARQRMQQRGVSLPFLHKFLDHADVERPSTANCRLYRVTRKRAKALGDDRLGRFAIIWSDDSGQIVTVLPISSTRAGAPYRRIH